MAFLGRSKSNTHEVKSAKVGKTPRVSKAPKMSRKEKKAAAAAAKAASAMSAAAQADFPFQQPSSAYSAPAQSQTAPRNDYNEPRIGDLTVGDYANGMPRIRLGEFFNSFGRQLKWVIPLLIAGVIASWFLTDDFKRTYSGEGRVLVQLGDEYVYDSVNSNQSQGLQLTPDHIVQNEVGIMKNADIIEQVVGEIISESGGLERFSESAAEKIRAAQGDKRETENAWVELYTEVENSFVLRSISLSKNTSMRVRRFSSRARVILSLSADARQMSNSVPMSALFKNSCAIMAYPILTANGAALRNAQRSFAHSLIRCAAK